MDKSISSILEKQAESSNKIETLIEDSYYQQTEHLDALNKIESAISDTYLLQVEQLDKLTNIEKLAEVIASGSTSYTSEEKLENTKREERSISLLEEIAKNIGLLKESEPEEKKPELEGIGLGGILAGLAAAIGSIVGIIGAYVKQFKFFLKGFTYFVEEFKKAFKFLNPKLYEDIAKDIEMGLSKIRKVFSSIGEWVETTIGKFKKIFTFGEDSKIGKIITGFKQSISNFFEPLVEMFKGESKLGKVISSLKTAATMFFEPFLIAFQELKGFFTSGPIGAIFKTLKNTIGFIGEGIAKFGSLFGKVAGIIGKLFLPLTIIMTIWDTVKGAIEGFEKDGIIGGITGAIKGLVDSVVMAPLDALKSIVSWIAEKFGFENISAFLDSFSFEEMFNSLFDTIPEAKKAFFESISTAFETVVTTIKDWFSSIGEGLIDALAGIGIPEFTIPVPDWMGGPITLGPWYPFKGEEIPQKTTEKPKPDNSKQNVPDNKTVKEQSDKIAPPVKGANNVKEEPTSTKTGATYIPYKEPTKVESVKVEEPKIVTPTKTKLEGSGSDYILAEQSIATAKLNKETASDNGWMNPQVETAPRPSIQEQLNNLDAQQVYQKSAENVDKKEDMATKGGGNTVVSAPTVNTSNKTVNQQSIKLPTRNPDSTSSRYVSSRYAVQ
jgi:hypothetical protein